MIIYKITNKINNKIYIGLTTRKLQDRWSQHLYSARKNQEAHLYRAMSFYGVDNFTVEQIDVATTISELKEKEKSWIAYYNSNNPSFGYNITQGGDSNPMYEDAVKFKHLAKMQSEEVRNKISQTMKKYRENNPFSAETRQKISQSALGNQKFKGLHRTPEAIQKTVESHYKRVYCENEITKEIREFNSIKEASYWYEKEIYAGKSYKQFWKILNKSHKQNRYINGFRWKYK